MKKQLLFLMMMLLLVACSKSSENEKGEFYEWVNKEYVEIDNIRYHLNSDAKVAEVIYFYGYQSNLTIPESISFQNVNYRVTNIDNRVFTGCPSLTSVTIPNSVTRIGSNAFSFCESLTTVTIPNSVTSIGDSIFFHCSSLATVIIGNSVTSIGERAFAYCSSLTSVTIPNSVTSIGSNAFFFCEGLTSVTIPNSVTSIGSGAFSKCSGLTSITIPNSVTSIPYRAFDGCSGLTSVIIGSGVKNIGEYVFSECTKLADVYCYAESVPYTESKSFAHYGGLSQNITPYINYLHVKSNSIDAYKAAYNWKYFRYIVALKEGDPSYTGIMNIKSDKKDSQYYDLKGNKLEKPTKGINIINGKKIVIK